MLAGKAVLIQFDWDQMRVVGTQVLEQQRAGDDVVARAHGLKSEVEGAFPRSEFVVLANKPASEEHCAQEVAQQLTQAGRFIARYNPWDPMRAAD